MQFVDAQEAAIIFFRHRELAQLLALPALRLIDVLVKSFDGHGVIRVVQRGAEFGEGLNRVVNRPAMEARM